VKSLFYGWYIVITCLVLSFFHHFVFAYGWTAFVNPIVATFGWSMTQISLASSLRGMETGVFNPIWGLAIDRLSPRWLMFGGTIVSAAGALILSRTTNLAMYYIGFMVVGLGTSLTAAMLPQSIIARWFRKDIGKANGIFFMGAGIGGVMIPLLVKFIDRYSWQTALLWAAGGYFILGMVAAFTIRKRPEDRGLHPDGRTTDTGQNRTVPLYDFSTPVKKLLVSRAFWSIGIVFFFQSAVMNTVMLFAIPYLTGLDMDRTMASTVIMWYTLVSIFGRIPMGTFSDFIKKKYVIAMTSTLTGIGLVLFSLMSGSSHLWFIIVFAIVYGAGLSGVMALRAPIQAEYFGTRNFGIVFGLVSLFSTLAAVVSQPIAGWLFDNYNTYKPVWLALAGFSVVATLLMLTLPPSQKRLDAPHPSNDVTK